MKAFNLLKEGWEFYYNTMMNILNAYPVLGYMVLLTILLAAIYSTILSIKISKKRKQKSWTEVFDLKSKYENPSPVAKTIEAMIYPVLELPIKLLEKVIIWTTKIIVYLITIIAVKIIKIRYKVR